MEWVGIGALAGLCVAGVTMITFWVNWGDKISAAKAEAAAAKAEAVSAMTIATETRSELHALQSSLALYREQIAANYIHREVMSDIEDRLTTAIDRLGDRLDRFTEAVIKQRMPSAT